MSRRKRKRLFVDPKVQGAFLLRIFTYWFLCLVMSGVVLYSWMTLTRRALHLPIEEFWAEFGPAVMVSALMLPILLFDSVRLTNRLAGPMHKVRRAMRNLANGEPSEPIHFRAGDFWRQLADDYNAVRQRMMELEERTGNTPLASPPEHVEQLA